jgi:HAD superfamily hydrolase (TIGR01484 family)
MTASWLPRVVATDLDGTLLRSDGTVSARTVAALELARSSGARVVVVTARPPRHVTRVLGAAGWSDALAVCSNGAVIYDVHDQRVVSDSRIAEASAVALAADFADRMPEVAWAVETGFELVSGPGWGYTFAGDEAHHVRLDQLADLWTHPLVKVLGWSGERTADELLGVVRALGLPDIEPTHSGGPGIIELSAGGTTKAGALAGLCRGWGVAAADVAAFGDMPNDVPMLRWSGRSWAVDNAHEEARVAAGQATASNDDDGVALVLESLFAQA